MEYRRLGQSGLKVGRIGLGCMSYEDPTTTNAHTYQLGTSEEVVGRAIRRYSRREDIVLATKVFGRMHDGPGGRGLSRKAILEQVDASLTRLGTDYIDLYQIHRFDPDAPVEETME